MRNTYVCHQHRSTSLKISPLVGSVRGRPKPPGPLKAHSNKARISRRCSAPSSPERPFGCPKLQHVTGSSLPRPRTAPCPLGSNSSQGSREKPAAGSVGPSCPVNVAGVMKHTGKDNRLNQKIQKIKACTTFCSSRSAAPASSERGWWRAAATLLKQTLLLLRHAVIEPRRRMLWLSCPLTTVPSVQ